MESTWISQKLNPTVKILNVGTDRSEQTVRTLIRLLLQEQSDQGLHCFPNHMYHTDTLLYRKYRLLHFLDIYDIGTLGVQIFRTFIVLFSDVLKDLVHYFCISSVNLMPWQHCNLQVL